MRHRDQYVRRLPSAYSGGADAGSPGLTCCEPTQNRAHGGALSREGAFGGSNPVQGAMIPGKAREPEETFAYNLVQILRILDILPLLPKAVVATAAFAGLREGELRRLQWPDYTGDQLGVYRSVWKDVVNRPKTRCEPPAGSCDPKVGEDSG